MGDFKSRLFLLETIMAEDNIFYIVSDEYVAYLLKVEEACRNYKK